MNDDKELWEHWKERALKSEKESKERIKELEEAKWIKRNFDTMTEMGKEIEKYSVYDFVEALKDKP